MRISDWSSDVCSSDVFVIIQLPPGDYLTTQIAEMQARGESVDQGKIDFLRRQYGLGSPPHEPYTFWARGMLHGDLGYSFESNLPVTGNVGERLFLTSVVSYAHIVFTGWGSFP